MRRRWSQVSSSSDGDEPLPPKTAGTTRAVAKAQDSKGGGDANTGEDVSTEDLQKAWAELSDEERGMWMLKASLANPGMIRLPLQSAA